MPFPWISWSRGGRLVLAALAVGIALRVVAVLSTPVFPTVANTWDSNFYHETATTLAGGEGYTFQGKATAYYPPGFPLLLGAVYRLVGPHPPAGQALNVLLSLILLGFGVWTARDLLGRRAAAWAAVVLALEPSQIVMPAFLMSETLCGAALTTAVASALLYLRGRGRPWLAAAALSGALAGLTRGHALPILPAVILSLHGGPGISGRRVLSAAGVVVAVVALVLAGWTLRNERRLGKPILLATNSGINLLLGNNPNARGARADPPGGVPQTGNEVVDEEIAVRRALDYIRGDPGRFLVLLPVKAFRLLAPAPATTYRAELRAKWGRAPALAVLLAAQLAHVAAWVFAALAWWRARREARGTGLRLVRNMTLMALAVWTLGHLPFLGGARYFFPIQPFLLLAAVGGLQTGESDQR